MPVGSEWHSPLAEREHAATLKARSGVEPGRPSRGWHTHVGSLVLLMEGRQRSKRAHHWYTTFTDR